MSTAEVESIAEVSKRRRKAMPSRAERAAAKHLHHRLQLEELDVSMAKVQGLSRRLSASDRAVLKEAYDHPLDVEELERKGLISSYSLLWYLYYKLVATWIDPSERLWVRTTRLGIAVSGEH